MERGILRAAGVVGGIRSGQIVEFFARDGRTVWVHGEARVVRDADGCPLFIQGVAFDITDIKAAEERLREAQETLLRTEKLAAIGRLAASIGHELRNPLAAIRNAWFYSRPSRGPIARSLDGQARPTILASDHQRDRPLREDHR